MTWHSPITRIFRNVLIFFFTSTILSVVILKWVPVYYTPLMLIRCIEQVADGDEIKLHHKWTPIESISANMPLAVMASEDANFLKHDGFDFEQIYEAQLTAMRGGRQRGASTISQQTAKNVFLWPGHSWIRKGFEAYFTVLIERIWGKERIMEVYLNSIEMGRGIYGVQAVAHDHFDTRASLLTRSQAALIAATLPNPLRFNSAAPSAYMKRRRQQILHEMHFVQNPHWGVSH